MNSCDILRQPPPLKTETRAAIFADRPVATWVAAVNSDGKKAGCW